MVLDRAVRAKRRDMGRSLDGSGMLGRCARGAMLRGRAATRRMWDCPVEDISDKAGSHSMPLAIFRPLYMWPTSPLVGVSLITVA